ncbi:hypothetical protein U1Q18_029956 [Sarracenia purpurea var. burkii]
MGARMRATVEIATTTKLLAPEPSRRQNFLRENSSSTQTIVCDVVQIKSLPTLEIIAGFSVWMNRMGFGKRKGAGARATNTPDEVTDDVADVAIGLFRRRSGEFASPTGTRRKGISS